MPIRQRDLQGSENTSTSDSDRSQDSRSNLLRGRIRYAGGGEDRYLGENIGGPVGDGGYGGVWPGELEYDPYYAAGVAHGMTYRHGRPTPRSKGVFRRIFEGDHAPMSAPRNFEDGAWSPGVHAGKGPKGFVRSDERIMEEVCEHLARDPEIDASDIEVMVNRGEVTLTGTVPNRHTKRIAEDCIEDTLGVTNVLNNLRISQFTA